MSVHLQEDSVLQCLLRIGDTVLLFAKEAKGYVYSELTSERHNSVALYKVDSMRDPCIPNVHFASFTIVRANKYKAQERYNKYAESLKSTEKPTADEKGKLQLYERELKLEGRENELEQERLRGSKLVYGDEVQLLHTLTKKYLSVNTTKISRTENTNLRVELTPHNAQGCIFKILPRYKVRSVGDEIRYNDQVKFESVKADGQFLHCSATEFRHRFTVLERSRELNLSATESAFTLVPHYRPSPDHPQNAFKGGAVVRLFHREYECYLSAEGSFAEIPPVVEDVHCRKRHSDRGQLKDPSTSANVYWQFEKEADPRSGEPLYWGERCRIKHLPTRLYLTVVANVDRTYSVSLKERSTRVSLSSVQDNLDTMFTLSPVIQEGDTILTESYARIKHLQTGTWLHLEKGEMYVRRGFNPDAVGLEGLEWDSAELYQLTATETMNFDDAYTLESVTEDLVDKFNHVAGIVPVLTAHIQKYDVTPRPLLDSRSAYMVESALTNLADYLDDPLPRETKNRQKLLRNLRILELVIKILGFFSPDAPDKEAQQTVCKGCYSVIKSYLNGDSRKNEKYLARFIPFFKQQVNMGLNAEEVLIEMVMDNSDIVSRVAATELGYMIEQVVKQKDKDQKDPRFMEFLGNLCVCAGRPIPVTQKAILHNLVMQHGHEVFYHLEVGVSKDRPDAKPQGIYIQAPGSVEWRDLVDITSKNVTDDHECEYLESQLSLFARLCKGNNAYAIRSLGEDKLGWLNFDLILLCARNPDLRPSLRSKFVEVMIVMYVDVGNNRNVLENLSLSFVYDQVVEKPYEDTGKADTIAFTGEENLHFPDMRAWILDHITAAAQRGVVMEELEDNKLLVDVLTVLKQLVQYGYYDDAEDVDAVLIPLTKVLDGFSDRQFSQTGKGRSEAVLEAEKAFLKRGRYLLSDGNKPIFDIKQRAMEVVDLFLNFRFYIRLQRFIYEFRVLKGSLEDAPAHQVLPRAASTPSQLEALVPETDETTPPSLGLESLLRLTAKEVLSAENSILVQLARDRLKHLFSLSEYYIERGDCANAVGRTFPELLLDLAQYNDDGLNQESLYLLNRFYSTEVTLFDKAIQTVLLVSEESKRVFEEIKLELPRLRRNMSIDAGTEERVAIMCTLQRFTAMCTLEGDETVAHGQNQRILYNYGVMSDVVNYVLYTSKNVSTEMTSLGGDDVFESVKQSDKGALGSTPEGTDTSSVFVECFRFLKALAKDNLAVQQRIYERMEDLLDIGIAVPAIGELLTEVFTGGTELCLKVTEAQVEHLFSMIAYHGVDGRAELILTLQALAKVESLDLPVKWNQASIIKYFSKTRDKFCNHILGEGEEKVKDRRDLLLNAEDNDPDLVLLLAMTDLLASCAEGENLFIESVCQKVFSVEELVSILTAPKLQSQRKRPFVKFFVSVYMVTTGDKHSSGVAQISHSEQMWAYLESVDDLLKNLLVAFPDLPSSEVALLRHSLSSISKRYSANVKDLPSTEYRNLAEVTGPDGQFLPGVLLYLTDGILPLLHAFFDGFFDPSGSYHKTKEMKVADNILYNLLQLCKPVTNNLSTDAHIKLYKRTLLTMLVKGEWKDPLNQCQTVFAMLESPNISFKAVETAAMGSYRERYSGELELNRAFNSFVTNFKLSYQGQNDARAQIGSKYANPYTEFLDEEQSQPGDEYLPLGPSFQAHVSCFVSPNGEVSPSVECLLRQLEISFRNLESVSETERQRRDELDIKCLQIMRAIIHNEIVSIDPDLMESSPPGYRKKCVARVQPRQNAIQNFDNAVSRVVPMLSHPNDSVVREVLAFLKAIFYSGNRHVQEGMKYLLENREERLFSTLHSLLQNAAITYNEQRALLAQMDSRVIADQLLQLDPSSLVDKTKDLGETIEKWRSKFITQAASVAIDMENEDSDGFPVAYKSPSAGPGKLSPIQEDVQHTENTKRMSSSKAVFELKALSTNKDGTTQAPQGGAVDHETADLLTFRDTHHVKLALQVLGLICDGQYRLMQNYLREQKDNMANINIVGEVALFLQHFSADINTDTMDLVHLILQTLIEMCVGNYPNQVVIYNKQIIESLNHILAIDIVDQQERVIDGIKLKGSAIELLEAMLEETNNKMKELVMEISGSIDVGALHSTLCDFRMLMQDPRVQEAQFDDDAETSMFRTYHVLVHLSDHYGVDAKTVEPAEDEESTLTEAWAFCKRQSKSVEVFYENMDGDRILTRVHFPFNPDHELREDVIEKVKWNVNRDSPEDKLRDFLKWMKAVKRDTIHHARLHNFIPTRILTSFPELRHKLLILWSVLMNILLLMSFVVPPDDDRENYNLEEDVPSNSLYTFANSAGAIKPGTLSYLIVNQVNVFEVLLYLMGAIHLVMTLWFVIEYFVINFPNFRLPRFIYRLKSRWCKTPEETYSDVPIFGLMTVYVVFFLLCSILSLAFHGYLYCFCLLHVIINNDILQRVLRSITKNGLALIWVSILGMIVLFIYAVVSFAFLHESFLAEGNSDGDLFCTTLYECFVSSIRYGLLDNLGLIVPLVPTEFGVSAIRLLYDVSFFIIVTTIGLNIVFGIIVDTFSELRDERFRTEQDKKAVCFICGLPSHEFERRAQGFDHHVKCDHNMWAYIYYSIYLDQIDISDHNAIQSFVYNKIREGQLDFFPLLEALALESEDDEMAQKLDELKKKVHGVLEWFKKEDHEKSRRSKLQDQKQWEEIHLRKEPSLQGSIDYSRGMSTGFLPYPPQPSLSEEASPPPISPEGP